MNNDFKTLVDFLDHLGAEVVGHNYPQPNNEVAAKLLRFATGGCSKKERKEVCEMIHLHPHWCRFIADRIRMSRGQAAKSEDLADCPPS